MISSTPIILNLPTASCELVIMPPGGGISGNRESNLKADLVIWNRGAQLGIVFSSFTVFRLPSGGDRSPNKVTKVILKAKPIYVKYIFD